MAFADETYTSLFVMLQQIGIKDFNIVTHDRGTIQGDVGSNTFIISPVFAPQDEMFRNAPYNGIMEDPKRFVVWGYTWVSKLPIPDEEMARVIQEYLTPSPASYAQYHDISTRRAFGLGGRNDGAGY
jgi:hypothetical protein